MAETIDFYYDVSSPWTYLAFTNIQPLAKEAGATIHWKPFLVGGVFNTVNPTMYRMRENPVPARDRSEEHTSELQSLMRTSYAVFCLKKQKQTHQKSKHVLNNT